MKNNVDFAIGPYSDVKIGPFRAHGNTLEKAYGDYYLKKAKRAALTES